MRGSLRVRASVCVRETGKEEETERETSAVVLRRYAAAVRGRKRKSRASRVLEGGG